MANKNSKRTDDKAYLVLQYMKQFRRENGVYPTLREIGEGCGIGSTSVVSYYLDKLAKKNLIELSNGKSRFYRVLDLREVTLYKCPMEAAGKLYLEPGVCKTHNVMLKPMEYIEN